MAVMESIADGRGSQPQKAAIIRLFAAFTALESSRLCYMRLSLRIFGAAEGESMAWLLLCLAVIAGMALAPRIMDKTRFGAAHTLLIRVLISLAAIAAAAGCFAEGYIALALSFIVTACMSGAVAVCLRHMIRLLPPRRTGLAIGFSFAVVALIRAILFWPPFAGIQAEIVPIIMFILCASAFFCFNAKRFAAIQWIKPLPAVSDRLPSKQFMRKGALILGLFGMVSALFNYLHLSGGAMGQTPNSMFYLLMFAAVVYIAAGYAFERLSISTAMICGFALLCAGQSSHVFQGSAMLAYPYTFFSNMGNSLMEVYLIALPIAYCALARRGQGLLPGLGYILQYGCFFIIGVLFELISDNTPEYGLDAALFVSVAAIAAIIRLIREGRAARLKRIETGLSWDFAESPICGPSLESFSRYYSLTKLETKILRCMLGGEPVSIVAAKLTMQEKDVRSHIRSMLTKTGVKTHAEIVSLFRRTVLNALTSQDIRRALSG